MKRLVADTGPILHLREAGALHLLPLIGSVILSPLVCDELQTLAPKLRAALPQEIEVQELSAAARERASAWLQAGLLDGGEAEALALALAMKPDWFLTDDAAARLMAEAMGIEAHGSLGGVFGRRPAD
jgi:predicted nucleic acid-binding protein